MNLPPEYEESVFIKEPMQVDDIEEVKESMSDEEIVNLNNKLFTEAAKAFSKNSIYKGYTSTTNPIEKYCEREGYKLAANIDSKMALVIKPKPTWCPEWLYRRIIKESVEIVKVN